MASNEYSDLAVSVKRRGNGQFRSQEINNILDPLINRPAILSEAESKKAMKKEFDDYGFCFIEKEGFKKQVFSPKQQKNRLHIGFSETIGDISCLSATENPATLRTVLSAREITFGTRFRNIRASYFEHWKYDSDNFYLQKIFLHLIYQEDRDDDPKQFFAIHADPDLNKPYPQYNGVTHVHVGDGVLSNMYIVTSLTSRGLTFSDIGESDRSFALAVKQICRELEREKLSPFKYP